MIGDYFFFELGYLGEVLELGNSKIGFQGPIISERKDRFAIVTFVTPNVLLRWSKSMSVKNCYAATWGYNFIVEPFPDRENTQYVHWLKPITIAKYLPFYDVIFFVDSDTYFTNLSTPLSTFIGPDDHIVVSDEDLPPILAGMVMIRNSQKGFAFLLRWLNKMEKWDDFDGDNAALIQTILEEVVPQKEAKNCDQFFGNYKSWCECFYSTITPYVGSFGHREHKAVHFLRPEISWSRFSDGDLERRATFTLPQVRPYRSFKSGDFLVHAKYEKLPSIFLDEVQPCDVNV